LFRIFAFSRKAGGFYLMAKQHKSGEAAQKPDAVSDISADIVDTRFITIKGARVNNLQNVDLQIPKNRLVVVTGVSGSGKSSITIDTLYAEGQRRYVESLSRLYPGDLPGHCH
jgi:ABC-type transport system involved in cytochrome bd biosynthesis fused ATPase/permease subunit